MIVVDASAALAILLKEADFPEYRRTWSRFPGSLMSAINFWEVLVRSRAVRGEDGLGLAEELLAETDTRVVPADARAARDAAAAFARFGRKTPAGLNLGDCFAYALAKRHGAPLLFKGADFARTDVESALAA
jgi:ribonuclease VapC